jgi:hypothetical protein
LFLVSVIDFRLLRDPFTIRRLRVADDFDAVQLLKRIDELTKLQFVDAAENRGSDRLIKCELKIRTIRRERR